MTILKLYLSSLDEELQKKIIENDLKYLGFSIPDNKNYC